MKCSSPMSAGATSMALRVLVLAAAFPFAKAQAFERGDREEIIASARTLASDLMEFYNANETGETPRIIVDVAQGINGSLVWGESGTFWATFIDYWRVTGDDTYNGLVTEGLLNQSGEDHAFADLDNLTVYYDEWCNWASTALLAAESRLPSPAGSPQWLDMAESVFGEMAARLDNEDGTACGGGLPWTSLTDLRGGNDKNTHTNGCFLDLGARLARFTGNDTYAAYADKSWDWMYDTGFIDNENWRVYDGASEYENCTYIRPIAFSNALSTLVQGSAFMYNHTGSDAWRNRTVNLAERFLVDFIRDGGAFFEWPCEASPTPCHPEMLAYKGIAHRQLASSTQMAPFLADTLLPAIQASAQKAIGQCTGGDSGRQCSFYWSEGEFVDPKADNSTGFREQMNVLAAVSSLLISEADAPATESSHGSGDADGDDNDNDHSSNGSDEGSNDDDGKDGENHPVSEASLHGASLFAAVAAGMGVWGVMNL